MKRVLKLLLILLAVVLLLLLVGLLPAHRQIRAIEPVLPDFSALQSALAVPDAPVAVTFLNTASQRMEQGELGHPGVLIGWSDGRRFLIDTGMPPDKAVAFGRPIELLLGAGQTQTYGSLGTQLGAAVQQIRGIGFTHLHSDHTDGLPEICARQTTPATVFQAHLQARERNYTTDLGFPALAEAACPRQALPEASINAVPGFPGLVAVSMGGHTPGSTLFVARLGDRYLAFSGDITNDRRSLRDDLPKHWLYTTFIVPEHTARATLLRRWLRDLDDRSDVTVFPAHDVAFMAAELPLAFTRSNPSQEH